MESISVFSDATKFADLWQKISCLQKSRGVSRDS